MKSNLAKTPMITPPSLSGSNLRTYERIFQHPVSHNLEWREVRTMLGHLGQLVEEPNGHLNITRNGHTLVLHRSHSKDITDLHELMEIRHFLEKSEIPLPPAISAIPQLVVIRFEFTDPNATKVCIAGTFNNWQPEEKLLHSSGAGNWWIETALAAGTYEYCLVVDGKYIPDPLAKETAPNPFGGRNSVLTVFSSPEAKHLCEAENIPLIMETTNKRKPTALAPLPKKRVS
jgi:hypothetical protein